MIEWKEYKLGTLINSISKTYKFSNEKVCFLNTSDTLEGKVINHNYFDPKDLPGQAKKSIELNDILYSEIRPANKRYAFIDFNVEKYVVSTKLMVLRIIDSEVITPKYLYYFLTSDEIVQLLQMLAESRSGTFPQIRFEEISLLDIKLPPINIQNSIVELISSIDEKIEVNNKINQELEKLAQTLFKQWFIDFEFPNENGKPYKSSGGEMVESHLGEFPKGWETKTLNDITNISIGRTPPRQEHQWFSTDINDVKWISIRDMGNCGAYIHNTSEFLTEDAITKFNIPIIEKNTLIMSFKLTVGRVSITTERMLSNEAIAHLNIKNSEIYPEFLYLFLKQFNFDSLGSTSSIATAVNSKSIKSLPLIFPKIDILSKFEEIIIPLFSRIKNLTFENKDITNLRDTLLPKLISGELEINENNN
jgi:type I restriction enzyme S subunit